jgi:hypothetical protein
MELCFVQLTEVHIKVVQVWRSSTRVSKRIKNTYWEIYQEVVRSIQSTILSTK